MTIAFPLTTHHVLCTPPYNSIYEKCVQRWCVLSYILNMAFPLSDESVALSCMHISQHHNICERWWRWRLRPQQTILHWLKFRRNLKAPEAHIDFDQWGTKRASNEFERSHGCDMLKYSFESVCGSFCSHDNCVRNAFYRRACIWQQREMGRRLYGFMFFSIAVENGKLTDDETI